jgi:hypothetical protein
VVRRTLAADGRLIRKGGLRPGSERVTTAYTFTVDGLHTYYVVAGATSVLVHNSSPRDPIELAPTVDADNLKMTQTVANHFDDITRSGAPARPYMNSSLAVREIMEGSAPRLDPGRVFWGDSLGRARGAQWTRRDMGVGINTNINILRFNFVR